MATISDEELNELTNKVEFMLSQLQIVETFVNKLHKRVDDGDFDKIKNGMSLLDVKYHLLIMYCSRLCLYISMRSKGQSVANHSLLNQLAICNWILDKLRSIQKQCQYSIDKLLDHSKRSINNNNNNNNNDLSINDELSHKPDLYSLRPPNSDENGAGLNDISMNDINNKTNINSDGIYRPLKLNPKLMDTPQNILSRQQERKLQQFKKNVRNSDIYDIAKEMTDQPKEERFYLQNIDKFQANNNKNGSKTKLKDIENYEESNYGRIKQARREFKKENKKRKLRESSIGDNLNKFIDSLDKSFVNAKVLGDYQAGGNYNHTIGKYTKKYLKGGKYIRGSWQRRQRILAKNSKKGKKIASRKKWRQKHPLKTNPAKASRMKQHKFKNKAKVKRLLKKFK